MIYRFEFADPVATDHAGINVRRHRYPRRKREITGSERAQEDIRGVTAHVQMTPVRVVRKCVEASRMRDLTVPSGKPSRSAISG